MNFFNWYTIYEDCRLVGHLHPRFGVLSCATITRPERSPEIPEILKSVLKCPEIH